jgi:hypothetical protein
MFEHLSTNHAALITAWFHRGSKHTQLSYGLTEWPSHSILCFGFDIADSEQWPSRWREVIID